MNAVTTTEDAQAGGIGKHLGMEGTPAPLLSLT